MKPQCSSRAQIQVTLLFALVALLLPSLLAAQANAPGGVRGTVLDPTGLAVPNATVQVTPAAGGTPLQGATNATGGYNIANVPAGTYTVAVTATGFATFQRTNVVVAAGRALQLDINLSLQQQQEQVTVSADALQLDTSASSNASQVVITQAEMDALPDDPDELQADLESLAGPGAGPNGGQMYIDGFTAGQLPPKSSIREIRINSDPFSAEYDQVGFGRIEILTKPGGGAWHGSVSENNNSFFLNSRSPFSLTRGTFESNQINGNVGGGLGKKASLFFNADFRDIANEAVINATVFAFGDPITPAPTDQALFSVPQYRLNIGPRLDWQVSKNNTLTARYQYERNSTTNSGTGNFTLPVQASNTLQTEDQIQVTDTQYLGKNVIYETHFQYLHQPTSNVSANLIPSISVPSEFTGGGDGNSFDTQNHYELQSFASVALNKHFLKFGARIRDTTDSSNANSAFYGAYSFFSLSAFETMIQDLNGTNPLTNTMAGLIANGTNLVTGQSCNTGGVSNGNCGPNQFSLTAGNPRANVNYLDAEPYIEDNWRARPNLTLSFGLRYEVQNHISDHRDFAPRVSVAWGLGGSKTTPKWVVRGGWGVFYTRFAEQNTLTALRQNGITEQEYIVANPNFYNGPVSSASTALTACGAGATGGLCPTPTQLASETTSIPTIYQVNPDLHAPYLMQTSVSLERQVSKSVQLSATYNNARGYDSLLEANVNSPVLNGTLTPAPACSATLTTNCGFYPDGTGVAPIGTTCSGVNQYDPNSKTCQLSQNIYQFESAGIFRQNQVFANVTVRPSAGKIMSRLTLNGYYVLNFADSTPNPGNGGFGAGGATGANGFVTNPYNVLGDYGQAGGRFGTRDTVFMLGTISLPHGIAVSPTLQIASGAPYTVTINKDLLGTSVLNQRAGFVSSTTCPTIQNASGGSTVYCTPVGTFDSCPDPGAICTSSYSPTGEGIVPVNSLRGPGQFTFNLRVTKTFTFGQKAEKGAGQQRPGNQGGPNPAGFGGQNARQQFPGPGGGNNRGRVTNGYAFTLSFNARNLFNNVNFAAPVGTLNSTLFGQPESLSSTGPGGSVVANRQFYVQGTFAF
jgi:hypothetical protein